MKLKIHILILLLFLSINLGAQEKYRISSQYKDISFTDFVTKVESILPVKFYYIDDWVKDLKLGDYPDGTARQGGWDILFRGTALLDYIGDLGMVGSKKN